MLIGEYLAGSWGGMHDDEMLLNLPKAYNRNDKDVVSRTEPYKRLMPPRVIAHDIYRMYPCAYPILFVSIFSLLIPTYHAHIDHPHPTYDFQQSQLLSDHTSWEYDASSDPIPFSTRAHWMRIATTDAVLLDSPCPFMPFGTVIVNHTLSLLDRSHLGEPVCMGVNHNNRTANPLLHGETAAIANCSKIMTTAKEDGGYGMTVAEVAYAWAELSIYTNGEPCPMCASAINWSGFREMIYGTSIAKLVDMGWPQIHIGSREVFARAKYLPNPAVWRGAVLPNETDPWFEWQFQSSEKCPSGCERDGEEGRCMPVE
ncbi:hypothetical protein M8818_006014 [Zalaria obscura]|uniref:Uncharacterized protein n=1 Tax=Zalaria obscura TaxID=2024903 RepID=A0ACC3S8J3_9PEZI